LSALKDVIGREKLYDPRNPTVVVCNKDLEKTLNVRALHVSEIK
jgi:hypothetical protein